MATSLPPCFAGREGQCKLSRRHCTSHGPHEYNPWPQYHSQRYCPWPKVHWCTVFGAQWFSSRPKVSPKVRNTNVCKGLKRVLMPTICLLCPCRPPIRVPMPHFVRCSGPYSVAAPHPLIWLPRMSGDGEAILLGPPVGICLCRAWQSSPWGLSVSPDMGVAWADGNMGTLGDRWSPLLPIWLLCLMFFSLFIFRGCLWRASIPLFYYGLPMSRICEIPRRDSHSHYNFKLYGFTNSDIFLGSTFF